MFPYRYFVVYLLFGVVSTDLQHVQKYIRDTTDSWTQFCGELGVTYCVGERERERGSEM